MTGFRTDITSSVWNFCRWDADVHPREMSPAERSVEKRLFSQANCGREAMWMAHMKCYVASRRKWRLVSRRDRRADVHVKLRKNLLSLWEDTTKRQWVCAIEGREGGGSEVRRRENWMSRSSHFLARDYVCALSPHDYPEANARHRFLNNLHARQTRHG